MSDTKENVQTPNKKKALGRGIGALMSGSFGVPTKPAAPALERGSVPVPPPAPAQPGGIQEIPVQSIKPNKEQPRTEFSVEKLQELADSIREQGILQPVIVKKSGNEYEMICGERRLRAAKECGFSTIPAIVKDLAEDKLLEWALIENIQREDLNPVEEAQAYLRLAEQKALSHEEIAKKVGKNRTTIVNSIRLLKLPKEILEALVSGQIQAGHARALLALFTADHQLHLLRRIVKENLTVRQVEDIVSAKVQRRPGKRARNLTAELKELETKLEQRLGTQVRVFTGRNNQGRLEIRYYSLDDLERILEILNIPKS